MMVTSTGNLLEESALQLGTQVQSPVTGKPAEPDKTARAKKKVVRRAGKDYSQIVRRSYHAAVLAMNVWLGAIFYYWVRGLELGTSTSEAAPPPGIEGWRPLRA